MGYDDDNDDEFEDSLGDDDFDYEEFVQQEFNGKSRLEPLWIFTTWVLLMAILAPALWALMRLM